MTRVKGDPLHESKALVAVQRTVGSWPGSVVAARGLSHFGEHALGWFGVAAVGMAVDPKRREGWAHVGVAAFVAHAASVVIKRIIRRPRPHHPDIQIGVGTPSKLSFPSSHATSTTAALLAMAWTLRSPAPLAGVPLMAMSRLVLGVHYPTDVLAGSAVGAVSAAATRPLMPAALQMAVASVGVIAGVSRTVFAKVRSTNGDVAGSRRVGALIDGVKE